MESAKVQSLLDEIISNTDNLAQKIELKNLLKFDDLNIAYLVALYQKYRNPEAGELPLYIHEKNVESSGDVQIVYPTAIATDDHMKHLPVAQYHEVKNRIDTSKAKDALLWIKKMQAGTGSSMTRNSYLAEISGVDQRDVKIGAKGTDLYIELGKGKRISIAEAQVLQAITDAKSGFYGDIALHDIVSNETEESIEMIWNKPSIIDPKKTYREIVKEMPGIDLFGKSYQYHIPTLNVEDHISFNRQAPGGHALFGVDALRAAYRPELRPAAIGKRVISSVGNGEDLSSTPDPVMVSWMIEDEIPLAMVTTTKTEIDLKGGQIAIVPKSDGSAYVTMVEKAQAETANQMPLFEELGLRLGDSEAFFNTNMVLVNYDALSPKISKLVDEIGEDEFMKIIAPDLIQNKKKQKEDDGVEREYTQLEGAMGSVVLNLDRYWRTHYGEPLVHFMNVDTMHRTKFFCPVKTAFDYYMQFHSDRFEFDKSTFRLINHNKGNLPTVSFKDGFYKDVGNVLSVFNDTRIVNLKSLEASGIIDFSGLILEGEIEIESSGEKVSIEAFADANIIKDCKLEVTGTVEAEIEE